MDKKKISKDYLEKIKLLEAYNKNYYDNNSPIISDQEYDFFKKKIIDLENSYKFLNNKKSPSKIVGFKPSKNFEKVKHKVPMLSLGNAFDEEDLKTFEKKIFNFLSLDEKNIIDYTVSDSAKDKNVTRRRVELDYFEALWMLITKELRLFGIPLNTIKTLKDFLLAPIDTTEFKKTRYKILTE